VRSWRPLRIYFASREAGGRIDGSFQVSLCHKQYRLKRQARVVVFISMSDSGICFPNFDSIRPAGMKYRHIPGSLSDRTLKTPDCEVGYAWSLRLSSQLKCVCSILTVPPDVYKHRSEHSGFRLTGRLKHRIVRLCMVPQTFFSIEIYVFHAHCLIGCLQTPE